VLETTKALRIVVGKPKGEKPLGVQEVDERILLNIVYFK
jgi:hypothetical protein